VPAAAVAAGGELLLSGRPQVPARYPEDAVALAYALADASLPAAHAAACAAPPSESAAAKLVIDVDREGHYSILGEELTLETLSARIAASQGGTGTRHSGVVVRADRGANSAALNRLADRLAGAKIANWSLAVSPEGTP